MKRDELEKAVEALAKEIIQTEPATSRAPDELTLDAIAEQLGLTYEESVSALVKAKHRPPEAP